MTSTRHGRRGSRRGQAVLEAMLVAPVLLVILLSGLQIAEFISDQQAVGAATGQAARIGAELGNDSYHSGQLATGCQTHGPTDPCHADQQIFGQLSALLSTRVGTTRIIEVDIYRPQPCSGAREVLSLTCPAASGYQSATDLVDRYNASGALITTSGYTAPQYTLDLRTQALPNNASIGVSVTFQYLAPTGLFSMTSTLYAEQKLAPSFV